MWTDLVYKLLASGKWEVISWCLPSYFWSTVTNPWGLAFPIPSPLSLETHQLAPSASCGIPQGCSQPLSCGVTNGWGEGRSNFPCPAGSHLVHSWLLPLPQGTWIHWLSLGDFRCVTGPALGAPASPSVWHILCWQLDRSAKAFENWKNPGKH